VNPAARAAGASAWMADPRPFSQRLQARERVLTPLFRQEKLLLSVVGRAPYL
jgi:hypothetical protein